MVLIFTTQLSFSLFSMQELQLTRSPKKYAKFFCTECNRWIGTNNQSRHNKSKSHLEKSNHTYECPYCFKIIKIKAAYDKHVTACLQKQEILSTNNEFLDPIWFANATALDKSNEELDKILFENLNKSLNLGLITYQN